MLFEFGYLGLTRAVSVDTVVMMRMVVVDQKFVGLFVVVVVCTAIDDGCCWV